MSMQADSQRHREQAGEDRQEHRRWVRGELFSRFRGWSSACEAESQIGRQLDSLPPWPGSGPDR